MCDELSGRAAVLWKGAIERLEVTAAHDKAGLGMFVRDLQADVKLFQSGNSGKYP